MANYKQTPLTGESYQRCRLVEIHNPLNSLPSVIFTEERITTVGDLTLRDQPDAPMTAQYDPAEVIEIYDPVTLLPTGTAVTMGDIYGLLFSAYFHYATIRDTPAVIPEPEPEPVVEPEIIV